MDMTSFFKFKISYFVENTELITQPDLIIEKYPS